MMMIIAIDVNKVRKDPIRYFDDFMSELYLGGSEDIKTLLFRFVSSGSLGCMTIYRTASNGAILISSIWISSTLDESDMSACVANGIVGGMGTKADRFLDVLDENCVAPSPPPYSFSAEFQPFLALRYSDAIKLGWSESRVVDSLDEVRQSDCN